MPSWHLLRQPQKMSAEKIVTHSSKEGFFFVLVPIFLISQMGQIFQYHSLFWKVRANFLVFINLCAL